MTNELTAQAIRELSDAMKAQYQDTATWYSTNMNIKIPSTIRVDLPVQSGGIAWRRHRAALRYRMGNCIGGASVTSFLNEHPHGAGRKEKKELDTTPVKP